ncbi:MAG TPA: ABC transporter substrate-binding protein [Aggregatilineales bacterium]|nr:ABC transporter substrate-binding protein [Aggregatilineales bacterium]
MSKRSWFLIVVLALVAVLSVPATSHAQSSTIDCKGAKQGDTISVLYQWAGEEEQHFSNIVKPLADACGIVFKPESTRDQALLDTKVQAGTPPDIAFWTKVAMIRYQDKLVPMDQLGANKDNYQSFFLDLGSVNGKWLALTTKADIKTIIWYSPAVFKAKGYSVPTTWADLNTLVEAMVKNGDVPWSMGFESGDATGWTGQDFIEDIMLTTQGPDYVHGIISGKVPFTDPGVKDAWTIYGKWAKDPKYTVGGAQGTLSTNFNDAIYKVFSDPPQAMMVKQSGFAGGAVKAKFPDLKYGTDYDFFAFPGAKGVQGGADLMLSFSKSAAVQAFVTYLSSEQGAINWAKEGFDETPNKLGVGHYVDPQNVKKADAIAKAQGFVGSIGDEIPGGFAKAEWTGIVNFVNGKDIDGELKNVAQAQAEALKPQPTQAATAAK